MRKREPLKTKIEDAGGKVLTKSEIIIVVGPKDVVKTMTDLEFKAKYMSDKTVKSTKSPKSPKASKASKASKAIKSPKSPKAVKAPTSPKASKAVKAVKASKASSSSHIYEFTCPYEFRNMQDDSDDDDDNVGSMETRKEFKEFVENDMKDLANHIHVPNVDKIKVSVADRHLIIKVHAKKKLTQPSMKVLKDQLSGQLSDGWGNNLEQMFRHGKDTVELLWEDLKLIKT